MISAQFPSINSNSTEINLQLHPPPSYKPQTGAHLKARPLAGKLLVVQHGLQDLLVPAGHQAHGAHDLQHCHLGLHVLRGQALGDYVDALSVRENVSTTLRDEQQQKSLLLFHFNYTHLLLSHITTHKGQISLCLTMSGVCSVTVSCLHVACSVPVSCSCVVCSVPTSCSCVVCVQYLQVVHVWCVFSNCVVHVCCVFSTYKLFMCGVCSVTVFL